MICIWVWFGICQGGRQARKPKKCQSVQCRETNMLTQMQRITWSWWLDLDNCIRFKSNFHHHLVMHWRLLTLPCRSVCLQLCFTQEQRHKGAMQMANPHGTIGGEVSIPQASTIHNWSIRQNFVLVDISTRNTMSLPSWLHPCWDAGAVSWVSQLSRQCWGRSNISKPIGCYTSIFQSIKPQFHLAIQGFQFQLGMSART